MTKDLLLGIDLGAGSLKSMVIDSKGCVAGSATKNIETLVPRAGYSEQNPEGWWSALGASLQDIWASGVDSGRIAAVSLTAGAHTHVLEDIEGHVLRPAIMWNDQRSGVQAARARDADGERILQISGNRISPTWTLPQLMWLQEEEPENHSKIHRIRPAKDWLRRCLDGSDVTDHTDAWGLMLADTKTRGWSAELCALAGLSVDVLPDIVASTEVTGEISVAAAAVTGLRQGTMVICGTSDTNAETFSSGMMRPGVGTLKLATAGTVSTLTRNPVFSDDVIHYPHLVADHYYAILGTNSCASAHRWLRDALFADLGFDDMDRMAQQAPVGSGGLLFHPYLNGERSPYWDPDLRASFVGLGFDHGAPHFCRAAYEGIAFTLRDCLEVLRTRNMGFDTARLVGGGTKSELWRQIIADVTGLTIEIPEQGDASFGAALIAGIGSGKFSDTNDAARLIQVAQTLSPNPETKEIYDAAFVRFQSTKEALTPVNHDIAQSIKEAT